MVWSFPARENLEESSRTTNGLWIPYDNYRPILREACYSVFASCTQVTLMNLFRNLCLNKTVEDFRNTYH